MLLNIKWWAWTSVSLVHWESTFFLLRTENCYSYNIHWKSNDSQSMWILWKNKNERKKSFHHTLHKPHNLPFQSNQTSPNVCGDKVFSNWHDILLYGFFSWESTFVRTVLRKKKNELCIVWILTKVLIFHCQKVFLDSNVNFPKEILYLFIAKGL